MERWELEEQVWYRRQVGGRMEAHFGVRKKLGSRNL